jgi:predicted ATPase
MIKQLRIENFKSWNDTRNVRLAPLTGLFGANSSGKTGLLQLLLLLKQTTESPDRSQILNFGDERSLVELGSFNDLIHMHDSNATLQFNFSWEAKRRIRIIDPTRKGKTILFRGDNIGFNAEIGQSPTGRLIIYNFSYDFANHFFGMKRKAKKNEYSLFAEPGDAKPKYKLKRWPGRVWGLPTPVKCYGFPDQVNFYFQNTGFLSQLEFAFEELFSNMFYLGPLREYPKRQYTWTGAQPADMGRRGEKVVDAILASRERGTKISRGRGIPRLTVEEYVAYWLRELNLIHSFNVKPITKDSNLYQVWIKMSPRSSDVLITDVGFGVSQILPILTLCYYVPPGATIIMEQPEIHLHPTVQAGLADVIIDAIKIRNIQVIIESHSEHLLRRLQRRIAEEQISEKDTALYFSEIEGGVSQLRELEIDLFGNITNWPKGFFGDDFGEIAAMAKAKSRRLRKSR